MSDLPEWYPLANATDGQIDAWLAADKPPYAEMRDALPWLDQHYECDAWIRGVREARVQLPDGEWLATLLPGVALLLLPHQRIAGRAIA